MRFFPWHFYPILWIYFDDPITFNTLLKLAFQSARIYISLNFKYFKARFNARYLFKIRIYQLFSLKPKLTAKWAYTPYNSTQFNWRGINPIVVCVAVFGRLQQQLTKLRTAALVLEILKDAIFHLLMSNRQFCM